MKSYSVIFILLVSLFVTSCTDTLTDVGKGTLSYSDAIIVKGTSFQITSKTDTIISIVSQPDSFLLGTFNDTIFGTIRAQILAQLNCPVGFKFPANSVADSAKIFLNYYSCFGSTTSPLDINIYEMTKTFSYTGIYPSNIDPNIYCDPDPNRRKELKIGERKITAGKNSSTSKSIVFKDTTKTFLNRFLDDSKFNSTNDFVNYFKGIYITAQFGAATLLNIGRQQLNMVYYYHYIHGTDTINNYLTFPASSEVRQVNCIQYPDRKKWVKLNDTITYLASPANLYTELNLPLDTIQARLKKDVNGKRLTINSAILRVNVAKTEEDTALHPVVKYVLLIKDKDNGKTPDNFFKNSELPSDTCSVLGRYTVAQVGTTSNYERYYSFDVATLIANELKHSGGNASAIKLRLIPVAVGTSTSTSGTTSISSIKQQYLMSAVRLRGNKENTKSVSDALTLKIIYSGF